MPAKDGPSNLHKRTGTGEWHSDKGGKGKGQKKGQLVPAFLFIPPSSPLGLRAAGGQGAAAVAAGSRGGFVGAGAQAGNHQWGLGWAWSHHPHLQW